MTHQSWGWGEAPMTGARTLWEQHRESRNAPLHPGTGPGQRTRPDEAIQLQGHCCRFWGWTAYMGEVHLASRLQGLHTMRSSETAAEPRPHGCLSRGFKKGGSATWHVQVPLFGVPLRETPRFPGQELMGETDGDRLVITHSPQ